MEDNFQLIPEKFEHNGYTYKVSYAFAPKLLIVVLAPENGGTLLFKYQRNGLALTYVPLLPKRIDQESLAEEIRLFMTARLSSLKENTHKEH